MQSGTSFFLIPKELVPDCMTHVPDSGTRFLVPESGSGFWYVCHWHKSVTSGQCDARPTVAFPTAGHHRSRSWSRNPDPHEWRFRLNSVSKMFGRWAPMDSLRNSLRRMSFRCYWPVEAMASDYYYFTLMLLDDGTLPLRNAPSNYRILVAFDSFIILHDQNVVTARNGRWQPYTYI